MDTSCMLYLVQAGQTAHDARNDRYFIGRYTDGPLTETGLTQATRLGEALASHNLTGLFSSPQLASVQTAKAISVYHTPCLRLRQQLAAVDYGQWEGDCMDRLARQDVQGYRQFARDPLGFVFPAGESVQAAAQRSFQFLQQAVQVSQPGRVAVVVQGSMCGLLLAQCAGLSLDRAREIDQQAGRFHVIRCVGSRWALVAVNRDTFETAETD